MRLIVNGAPNTDPCPEVAKVPKSLVVCPECGGQLLAMVSSCNPDTLIPDEDGIEIDCENEPDIDDESAEGHRWWQGEWQPVYDRVRWWGVRHLRVEPNADREGSVS